MENTPIKPLSDNLGEYQITNKITIFRTKRDDENLCETCHHCFGDCNSSYTILGKGLGLDNVIECDMYMNFTGDNSTLPDYIEKSFV